MENKPTYKISASLINSYYYYLENKNKLGQYESFLEILSGKFTGNFWTERGNQYEAEVFEGKHGKVSELVKPLAKQIWGNTLFKFPEFNIRLAGKVDVIDQTNNIIYDIKRVDKFSKDKYASSVQHLLYFYLFPKVTDFYYIVTYGLGDRIEDTEIIHQQRPLDEELHKEVLTHIINFINAMAEDNKFWQIYATYQQYKQKGR